MNKDEALWVLIRAIGLVFLVLAFVSFADIATIGSYLVYAKPVVSSASGTDVAEMTAKTFLTKGISNFILYLIATFYFMRKGLFVHNVLSK